MKKFVVFVILTSILTASCSLIPGLIDDPKVVDAGYKMISVSELQALQESEPFTLINVHIPNEGNIPGTDLEIPFDKVENFVDILPKDKDEKIIIYCQSESMGNTAATTLAEMGFTNVSNLEGGYVAWRAAGLDFEEKK